MYRLVIADDEKTIRETIASLIDWKSLEIEVVAVCKNGNEAYDAILDEYPDIVLTDIRMPGMSGLEMIKRLRDAGGAIEFIILSGYGEFEYAKQAMELGVHHYLLKPCNEKEIMDVMQKAKQSCCRNKHFLELSIQQYSVKSDVFASRVWAMLENELTASADNSPFAPFSDFLSQQEETFHLYRYTQDADGAADLEKKITDYCCEAHPDKLLCFFTTCHNLYLLIAQTEETCENLLQQGGGAQEVLRFQNLKNALAHLLTLIQRHGQFSVLVHHIPIPLKGTTATPQAEKMMDDIKDAISGPATSNTVVDRTIQYMKEHLVDPDVSLKNIAETHLFMNVDYVSKQFVKFTGKRFSAYLNELRTEKAKKLLAENPDIKIGVVAEAVGCANNPQYFNYIFKKQTGMTPSAYQKSLKG